MTAYDSEARIVPGGKKSGVFDFDVDDISIHDEQGSSFSDLFGGSFYAEGGDSSRGVFEYEFHHGDYKNMLASDGKAASLEAALTAPVTSAGWKLIKPEGDQGQTDFLDLFLRAPHHGGGMRSNFQNIIGQATSARTYRKAFFEKTYKVGTGTFANQVVYDDIAFRPADTCKLWVDERTGRFKGFRQRAIRKDSTDHFRLDDNQLIDFPPPFCWVHINGQHRDPIGGASDMEVPLWCYKTKKRVLWMWAIFLSTQGEPRTVVSGPNAKNDVKELRKLKGGGYAATTDSKVDVLEPSGTGAQAFKDFMAYLDAQMLASRLAGFLDLTSPTQSTGSYALSADQSSFFKKSEERFRMEMEQSITDNVLADLVAINFGADAPVPKFQFEPFESSGIEEAIQLITPRAAELPFEFVAALAEKIASALDLPEDQIKEAMVKAGEVAEQKQEMSMQQQQQMTEAGPNPVANALGQVNKAADIMGKKTGMKPPTGNPFGK